MTANISLDDIEAIGNDVDAEIDGLLGTVFYWPFDENGNDLRLEEIPQQIITIANNMTAGILEQEQFAHTEAGGPTANPYGKTLETSGRRMLQRVIDFALDVPGLKGIPAAAQSVKRQSFFPVSGLPLASGPGRGGMNFRGRR